MTRTCIALLLLALATSTVARAEEPSPWEFEVSPYGWIAGNYGEATVDGHTVQIDTSPIDVLEILADGNAISGSGYFSARYDRWSLFADVTGGYVKQSVSEQVVTPLCTLSVDATARLRFAISDFGIGYRLGEWALPRRRRPFTVGVYAGARYMYFGVKLNASGGIVGAVQRNANPSSDFAWADPLIGVRWEVPVLDQLSLDFRGDIGGFGASSDLVWGLTGGLRYWLASRPFGTRPWLGAGYRVVAFDRTDDANNELDLQFSGPTTGLGFAF